MTKKRFIKRLMSIGVSRNEAKKLARKADGQTPYCLLLAGELAVRRCYDFQRAFRSMALSVAKMENALDDLSKHFG